MPSSWPSSPYIRERKTEKMLNASVDNNMAGSKGTIMSEAIKNAARAAGWLSEDIEQ
jgi:hypothetical protein